MKATAVTPGLAESNGSLLPGQLRDSLHVTCGLTACTPGSAPGPTLGNEYGKTLLFLFFMPFKPDASRASTQGDPPGAAPDRGRSLIFAIASFRL